MEIGSDIRALRVLRAFTVSKRPDTPNEDRHFISLDKMVCAVSDGASVSFDPAPWAEKLVRRFVDNQEVSADWIESTAADYRTAYDREAMSWSYQAAFDRGSFATLLGVVCSPEGLGLRVLAIGDSLVAFVEGEQVVRTIPYISAEEFDQSPILISTNSLENRSLDDQTILDAWHDLTATPDGSSSILLMTDAIGRWLLDDPNSDRATRLLNVNDDEAFASLVEVERAEGRMRRDDSTLVVVGVLP